MAEQSNSPLKNSVLKYAEISATANAEAKIKTAIWEDEIETESKVILEGLMGNYEP